MTAIFSRRDVETCAREVERQEDTPMHVLYLLDALSYARSLPSRFDYAPVPFRITEEDICTLNEIVDNGEGNYRKTPAVFNQGMPAISAENIPHAMGKLIDAGNEGLLSANEFVYEFLRIHPFADGNGRVAFLLYNLLNGTIDNVVPLPEFSFA